MPFIFVAGSNYDASLVEDQQPYKRVYKGEVREHQLGVHVLRPAPHQRGAYADGHVVDGHLGPLLLGELRAEQRDVPQDDPVRHGDLAHDLCDFCHLLFVGNFAELDVQERPVEIVRY